MRMKHRPAISVSVLIGIAFLVLCSSGCGKSGAGASTNNPGEGLSSPFGTIANRKVDIDGGVIEIAARRFGVIKDVLVHEGDVVRKGQILARQEDQDSILAIKRERAAVVQSQSQLVLTEVNIRTAQREYERLSKLASS